MGACMPGTHQLHTPRTPLCTPAGKAAPQPAKHPHCSYAPAASLATFVQPPGAMAWAPSLCQPAAAEGWQQRARSPRRSKLLLAAASVHTALGCPCARSA
jgi:hypothetical protein